MPGGEVKRGLAILVLRLEIVYVTLQQEAHSAGVTREGRLHEATTTTTQNA